VRGQTQNVGRHLRLLHDGQADFHNTFIKLGPLPLLLIRNAMLGEVGNPF
jgi:hypothetical protein